ncbi:hypothetical protein [Saccharicrinis aurantiacus]|uniref:hypothetical protein n=1 Tax=Saccharicrinis aurantiacus TaxID=1849719 RepID=UPI0024927CB0|nr:hypothetical protein [Saccharicrinis aurantiacus]
MANYNNNFITYDAYQVMQMHGLQYEGFIKGVGYAYTSDIAIAPDHMSGNGSPFAEPGLDQYMQGTVQWIDTSKEAIARSYNTNSEDIEKKILTINETSGIITLDLGFNNKIILPLNSSLIDIRVNSEGAEQTVSIGAINTISGERYYVQHKMVDLPLVYEKAGLLDDYNGGAGKVASSVGGSNPTLEGVSIDLLHVAIKDYIPLNGMSISFLKDSREYIGMTLTFNMNGQGLEGTLVGVNTVNGHRLDGKPLNIEDTFGYGNTTSFGAHFGSYSSSSNTYYDHYGPQQYQVNSYGISAGLPGAYANYETYTIGFSIPSLPTLIKKWINY